MYWMETALVHHPKLDICQTIRISRLEDIKVTTGEQYGYPHEIIYAPIEIIKQKKHHTKLYCLRIQCLKQVYMASVINTLRPRQSGRHFPDDIFKWIFFNENL